MLDSEADRLQEYMIDDEPVVEIDIHASGATIIAARENFPIPDVDDIYSNLKVHELERDLAKAVINHSISVGAAVLQQQINQIHRQPSNPQDTRFSHNSFVGAASSMDPGYMVVTRLRPSAVPIESSLGLGSAPL
jgi:hypothetical protein